MNLNLKPIAFGAVLLTTTIVVSAQEQLIVDSPFVHERSMVAETGELMTGAEVTPIYKQVVGLLPRGWDMVFTEQRLAIAPVVWTKGEQWTAVLDEWGHRYGANVMIDGKHQKIVVSPEQDKRPPGLAFVYSGNELHQELYEPEKRYKEAEHYVFERLRELQGTLHDEVTIHEAQAQLLAVANDIDDKEKALADAGEDAYVARQDKPLKWKKDGNYEVQEKTGRIRFAMKKGRLMPQIKELAGHLSKVSVAEGWWQWKASGNYEWSNDVVLEAKSVNELILRMMRAYKLTLEVKGNGVVHVYD